MGGTRSLTKIGAVFAAVVFTAVAPYKSAYAQTRTVGNFGGRFVPQSPGFRGRSRFSVSWTSTFSISMEGLDVRISEQIL